MHGQITARRRNLPTMNAQTPIATAPQPARKLQLRQKLDAALDVMAYEGQTQREAARRAGMNETALSRALRKPHIQAQLAARKEQAAIGLPAIKGIAQMAAYRVGLDLLHNSPDHRVRARMVELFAGETRGPAVAVQVNVPPATGYNYPRPDAQSEAGNGQVIEGKAIKPDFEE